MLLVRSVPQGSLVVTVTEPPSSAPPLGVTVIVLAVPEEIVPPHPAGKAHLYPLAHDVGVTVNVTEFLFPQLGPVYPAGGVIVIGGLGESRGVACCSNYLFL